MAKVDYESEHRLAVVMYGGVSLAIYIGGIARELLGMVRATSPGRANASEAGVRDEDLSKVERIYRRVARMADGVSWDQTAGENTPIRKRVCIDIVSGTSAGGINGIFLAKALANDTELDPILRLWVDEGDLAKLLNDRESVSDVDGLKAQNPPVALLNGERMYKKLLAAFETMDRNAPRAKRYDPGRVDLFVTTTDIHGEVINLPVQNAMAQEKRHRQRFQFTYDDGREQDFTSSENATLAFAARCTSSFPFAFEPFTWNDAARLAGTDAANAHWQDRLMYTSDNYSERPMGDGGYLDNKPFSYAIDELARRQSALDVRRTLLYVEPDPEQFNSAVVTAEQDEKPDAIANALAALITIPGYETIREDLQRVVERSERAEHFRRAEEAIEENLDQWMASRQNIQGAEWLDLTLDELLNQYGPGYGAYHHLKVSALMDTIADLICAAGGVARPEISQVIRDLVREWTKRTYSSFRDQQQFLVNADIDYRLRRLSFVLRRGAKMKSDEAAETRRRLKNAYDKYYLVRRELRKTLQGWMASLPDIRSDGDALVAIARLSNPTRREKVQELASTMSAEGRMLRQILEEFAPKITAVSREAYEALRSDHPDVSTLRKYYEQFQSYDVVLYPMARNSGIDEGVPVGIMRISPRDVRTRHTLRGMTLGHFGAFLEDDWRRNDILWGRLDAAETVIRLLVPDATVADPIVAEAQREIVAEQLGSDLKKRLAEAGAPKRDAEPRDAAAREKEQLTLDAAAKGCLADDNLLYRLFVDDGGGYDPSLNRQKQLVSAGRAGVIAEKILRGAALKSRLPWPAAPKLAAAAFAGVAQIAVPRSFVRVVAAYWARLLALLFGVLIAVGMLTSTPIVTWTGVKGLTVLTLGAIIVFFLERWAQRRLVRALLLTLFWIAAAVLGLWVVFTQFDIPIPRFVLDVTAKFDQIPWITKIDAFLIALAFALLALALVVWVVTLAWKTMVRPAKPAPAS